MNKKMLFSYILNTPNCCIGKGLFIDASAHSLNIEKIARTIDCDDDD